MSVLTNYSRKTVLGYPVDLVDQAGALSRIEDAWQTQKGMSVVTLNAEMIMAAQQDKRLDRIIRHTSLIIPDGSGVVLAFKLRGLQTTRVPGIDLANAALSLAASHGISVALIGSRQSVLEKLLTVLPKQHPNLKIVASHDGYFTESEEASLMANLAQSKPQLVLLALGVPKQEYFFDKWHALLPEAVFIGVGGSFDVWAGVTERAPLSFQRLHLEWLYRLIKEPWRYKRMGSTLPKFALYVLIEYCQSIFKKT